MGASIVFIQQPRPTFYHGHVILDTISTRLSSGGGGGQEVCGKHVPPPPLILSLFVRSPPFVAPIVPK